ncbi:hypothetical protein STRAU_0066 [Streptomyces aurantiacus JA 4570]|uniref:Uncharacterized protein n=2 Tax=Streptomyces aurantiacus TaxID=47760 RepID=S4A7Y3_9ACTN|nr:hypothetical protein STRAU_0066 [Streptomyces aurantiacus JA 4570]
MIALTVLTVVFFVGLYFVLPLIPAYVQVLIQYIA